MSEIDSLAAVRRARTWLFVPGDRPERFTKARSSGADAVIIDLEDAVAASEKERARRETAAALAADGGFAVRIGAPSTVEGASDIEALAASGVAPWAVVVAKAEDASELEEVARILRAPVIALVESAKGLEAAAALAASPAVMRLAFGAVDLSLDIEAAADDDVLAPVRSRLVMVSRAAGIAAPIDTPSLDIEDNDRTRAAATVSRRFGMGGKLCIHPRQVSVVASAFLPTLEEVARARRILDASDHDGAARLDGQMIDLPVLERARRVIAEADAGDGTATAFGHDNVGAVR